MVHCSHRREAFNQGSQACRHLRTSQCIRPLLIFQYFQEICGSQNWSTPVFRRTSLLFWLGGSRVLQLASHRGVPGHHQLAKPNCACNDEVMTKRSMTFRCRIGACVRVFPRAEVERIDGERATWRVAAKMKSVDSADRFKENSFGWKNDPVEHPEGSIRGVLWAQVKDVPCRD